MKNIKKRIIVSVFLILFILLSGAGLTGYLILKNSVADPQTRLECAGLENRVEITFDSKGIPQVWAANEHDALFAFGYLHAADRLFQMDLTRRVSQGRLSELLGSETLPFDIQQRLIGHDRLAAKVIDSLPAGLNARLQAYADGINYYVENCPALPFEYQLLRTEFEPWTVYDCLTIFSFQTWFSDFLVSGDLHLAQIYDKLGAERATQLNIPYPRWAPVTVPVKKKKVKPSGPLQKIMARALFENGRYPFTMAHSSNSWVIAPRRSASGRAMLASDPHLEINRLPQFWYYLGLHVKSTNINALGISTPGLPFITMGHNGRAAWAFTVAGVDINEYYLEQINKDSTQYLTKNGWADLDIIPQKIQISGQEEPYEFDVMITRHGPLIVPEDSLQHPYALHWAGYDVNLPESVAAGFRLARIKNWGEFRSVVTSFGALSANWTYADSAGNIGYQLGIPIPIRNQPDSGLPLEGWNTASIWDGFYPLEQTPHSLNPERGWLATCNNKQQTDGLPYELTGRFAYDRILRINELLNSKEKFSVSDMQSFQMDLTDRYLPRWKDILAEGLVQTGETELADSLLGWDGRMDENSTNGALMVLFINYLRHYTFDDELGRLSRKISVYNLENIFRTGPFEWFDDVGTEDRVEIRDEIRQKALKDALRSARGKTWGQLHTLEMRHPFAVVPVLSSLLDLAPEALPWHGSPGTLNASFFMEKKNRTDRFQAVVGPSWRFVIDFADPDGATMVLPAGNSGNPMSPHYMDFREMWKSGQRWNVPISEAKVRQKTVQTTVLLPFSE